MNKKDEQLQFLIEGGIVAIIRAESSEELITVFDAIRKGGIHTIEIAMTTPNALDVIRAVAQQYSDEALIGVGTVLDPETARAALLAGAEFVVGPTLNREVVTLCKRYRKIVIPGAFSPTEILAAWEMGADLVKVFPAATLGHQYLKDVAGPLPQIPLVPTGGINLENAAAFIKSGAVALAVGGSLVNKRVIAEKRFDELTDTARKFVEIVKAARQR